MFSLIQLSASKRAEYRMLNYDINKFQYFKI